MSATVTGLQGRLLAFGARGRQALNQVTGAVTGLRAGLASLGVAFAGRAVLQWERDIERAARRMRTTTETLSSLHFAFGQLGIAGAQATSVIEKLFDSISDAVSGDQEKLAAFMRFGMSKEELRTQNIGVVIERMAAGMQRFGTEAEKLGALSPILGKKDEGLFDLLIQGPEKLRQMQEEAAKFGAVLTGTQAEDAKRFGAELFRMTSQVEGLFREMLHEVLPQLIEMSKGLVDWLKQNKSWILDFFDTVLWYVRTSTEGLRKLFEWLPAIASTLSGGLVGGRTPTRADVEVPLSDDDLRRRIAKSMGVPYRPAPGGDAQIGPPAPAGRGAAQSFRGGVAKFEQGFLDEALLRQWEQAGERFAQVIQRHFIPFSLQLVRMFTDLAEVFQKELTDALADAILGVKKFGDALREFLKAVIDALVRQLVGTAVGNLFGAIFGGLAGGINRGGGAGGAGGKWWIDPSGFGGGGGGSVTVINISAIDTQSFAAAAARSERATGVHRRMMIDAMDHYADVRGQFAGRR
jgi:hypothetical protein